MHHCNLCNMLHHACAVRPAHARMNCIEYTMADGEGIVLADGEGIVLADGEGIVLGGYDLSHVTSCLY